MLAKLDRIEFLEEENRQLRVQIARLEGKDKMEAARKVFGATNKQAALICLLAQRGEATRSIIMDAVYGFSGYDGIDDGYQAVGALVKQTRRLFRLANISIHTVYGQGWRMPETAVIRLRSMLEGAR